jgi:hypothetical protein
MVAMPTLRCTTGLIISQVAEVFAVPWQMVKPLLIRTGAQFAAGDKVVCAEWFGETPPPAPRWYRRPSFDMDSAEYAYINRSLERLLDRARDRGEFAPMPDAPHHRLVELTDNELLHIALGVET